MRYKLFIMAVTLLFLPAMAKEKDIKYIHFERGTYGAIIKGNIKGYEIANYKFRARKGQYMGLHLETKKAFFTIVAPGKFPNGEAMFIGEQDGNNYTGTLPKSGQYTIQVYMMHDDERRGELSHYELCMGID